MLRLGIHFSFLNVLKGSILELVGENIFFAKR